MGSISKRYLYLPGINGNFASTPNASHLNVSTGLDFIFRIQPFTWTPSGGNKIIFSKYDTSGNQRGYQVQLLTTGLLRLTLSESGSSAVDTDSSVALTSLTKVKPVWLRITWRASDGRVQFFWAADQATEPTSWTQLGTNKTASITDIHPSTTALRFGANTLTTGQVIARFYNLIIKNAPDGTEVFNVDFTKATPDDIYITEDSSNAVEITVNSTETLNYARIAGRYRKWIARPKEIRTNATVTAQSAPSITKTNTPFNGNKATTSIGLGTPIWSNASNIYIAEPYADNTSHAARLNTSLVSQEEVTVNSAALNSDAGHRLASIVTDKNGIVITYPEGHDVPWRGKHTTSANDLSTLTSTSAPTDTSEKNAYKRYYRNPNNGDIWMTQRANGWYGYIRKWDETTKTFITKAGNAAVAGWGASQENAVYGIELAFSDDAMYLLFEWSDGGTGYPRRDATVIKSVDDGDTWTTLTGDEIDTPLAPGIAHVALPSPNEVDNLVQCRLVVDSDGNPMVIGAYKRATDSKRSLYVSRWNPSAERFEYRKVRDFTSVNIGNVSCHSYDGVIYVLFSQRDEHDDANWTTSNPVTPWATAAALWLYTSTDNGLTWNSYELDNGGGTDKWYGAYFDPESLRLHSKLRILPVCGSDFSKSQIWEFTL